MTSAISRRSGVLLHPSSLPGPYGMGDLGKAAYRFVDFLAASGQRLWQVLPLGPTGYGDSPYQTFSSFGGNPLLVSLEALAADGFLDPSDLSRAPEFSDAAVDYGAVIPWRAALLRHAAERFQTRATAAQRSALEQFQERNRPWLADLALFLALKARHGGAPWTRWDPPLAHREPAALRAAEARLSGEIRAHVFGQFAFFSQWEQLHQYCRSRDVTILGDLPIYVAHDSAGVWCHSDLFALDAHGEPSVVSGVPPDYFCATGQLWGNPVYRWDEVKRTGYRFWVDRVRAAMELFDSVRLDHFRGFDGYWEIPAGAPTAEHGHWAPGPGAPLFEKLAAEIGALPLVAENLGVITPSVEALRKRFGFPGMSILQFAFGNDPQAPTFLPHNYDRDLVAYTGTHDNDTVLGWWNSDGTGDSTRTADDVQREHALACRYLATNGDEINWVFIRQVMASVADAAVFPLQDILDLDGTARMNRPATATGNWRWRFTESMLTREKSERLADLAALYGRV